MNIKPVKTRVFQEGEDLFAFITKYFTKIPEQSIIVVTSKIVALSENRTVDIKDDKTKEELIRSESEFAMRTKHTWLTMKDGAAMTSAGIDRSNGNGKFILLPKDSFRTARLLRNKLQKSYNTKQLGVLIVDSRSVPLRAGALGVALGYAGFKGIKNHLGAPDIFKRKFTFCRTNIADSLATAAVLVMGEGDEQQPLALIKKAPAIFCETVRRNELQIHIQDDMYQPLFVQYKK